MKNVVKYIILGSFIVLLVGGGWTYYLFNLKTYDIEDVKVSEVTESKYVIDIPKLKQPSSTPQKNNQISNNEEQKIDGTSDDNEQPKPSTQDADQLNNQQEQINTETDNQPIKKSDQPKSNRVKDETELENSIDQQANEDEEAGTLSQKEIKQLYRPAFESLQVQATGKLNNLLTLALNEYKDKKASGEKISYAYFFQKYKTAAENLESNTNKAFEQIYSALETDLKNNGYSADDALEFKKAYEAAKESRKDAILEKAKGLL